MKECYIYILASKKNGVLYVGMKNNLIKRVFAHKNRLVEGFTGKYHVCKLVYYEIASDFESALSREKNIKKWKRSWKIELIEKVNPFWKDLYEGIVE